MSAPTVALVEDHQLLAETLCAALRLRGIDATAVTATAPATLLAAVIAAQPDLVLLDLDLGEFGDSTTLVAPLVAAGLRVLLVTGSTDRLAIAAALEQGAIGYQSKAAGFDALITSATAALRCRSVLDATGRADLLQELAHWRSAQAHSDAAYRRLTAREQRTLQALSNGHTVCDIAQSWVVSEATVRTHVRGVLAKLGVASQLAAVAKARRHSWLTNG